MFVKNKAIKLHPQWLAALQPEFEAPYMAELRQFLATQKAAGKIIYPAGNDWFNALNSTPLDQVKVVILGQDPYHGPGQAHGLSFSVPEGVRQPPSLVNIYKELADDMGGNIPQHGNLSRWAEQGVLLLNSVLTVEQGQAGAHQGKGWERFTDAVIHAVNEQCEHVVFMLWGAYAQKKAAYVDKQRHCILQAPHPSPLSAYRGFFGCQHFSKANSYLQNKGQKPINWL